MHRFKIVALVAFLGLWLPLLAFGQPATADLMPDVEDLGDTTSWEFWLAVVIPWLVTIASAITANVSSTGRFASIMKVIDLIALNIVKARNDPKAQ